MGLNEGKRECSPLIAECAATWMTYLVRTRDSGQTCGKKQSPLPGVQLTYILCYQTKRERDSYY